MHVFFSPGLTLDPTEQRDQGEPKGREGAEGVGRGQSRGWTHLGVGSRATAPDAEGSARDPRVATPACRPGCRYGGSSLSSLSSSNMRGCTVAGGGKGSEREGGEARAPATLRRSARHRWIARWFSPVIGVTVYRWVPGGVTVMSVEWWGSLTLAASLSSPSLPLLTIARPSGLYLGKPSRPSPASHFCSLASDPLLCRRGGRGVASPPTRPSVTGRAPAPPAARRVAMMCVCGPLRADMTRFKQTGFTRQKHRPAPTKTQTSYANPRSLARLQSCDLVRKTLQINTILSTESRLLPSLSADKPTRNIGSVRPDRPMYYNRSVCQVGGRFRAPPLPPPRTRKSTL